MTISVILAQVTTFYCLENHNGFLISLLASIHITLYFIHNVVVVRSILWKLVRFAQNYPMIPIISQNKMESLTHTPKALPRPGIVLWRSPFPAPLCFLFYSLWSFASVSPMHGERGPDSHMMHSLSLFQCLSSKIKYSQGSSRILVGNKYSYLIWI